MPVSLTTAKPGERFEDRCGEIWTYVRYKPGKECGHYLEDESGNHFSFTAAGEFFGDGVESLNDLLRALDSPAPAPKTNESIIAELVQGQNEYYEAWRRAHFAPLDTSHLDRVPPVPAPAPAEPMGDVGLVERLRCHRNVLLAKGDYVSSMHIDEAAIRIEALTTALDEARKVIAPFGKAAEHWDDIPGVYRCHDNVELWQSTNARAGHLNVRQLRAARDWHSKHGGGG